MEDLDNNDGGGGSGFDWGGALSDFINSNSENDIDEDNIKLDADGNVIQTDEHGVEWGTLVASTGTGFASGGWVGAIIGFVVGIFKGMDFQTYFGNMFKYGWSSWGATTNPEQIQTQMQLVSDLTESYLLEFETDPSGSLTKLDRFLTYGLKHYEYDLKNHARADSTKEAFTIMIQFFTKLRAESLDKIVDVLKSNGIRLDITKMTTSKILDDYQILSSRPEKYPITENKGSYVYNSYVMLVKTASLDIVVNGDGTVGTVDIDDDGNVDDVNIGYDIKVNSGTSSSKSMGGWLLAIAIGLKIKSMI